MLARDCSIFDEKRWQKVMRKHRFALLVAALLFGLPVVHPAASRLGYAQMVAMAAEIGDFVKQSICTDVKHCPNPTTLPGRPACTHSKNSLHLLVR